MGYFYDKKVLSFVKTEYLPTSLQEKTITPQNFTPVITPDSGYSALSKVNLKGVLVDPHQAYTSETDSTVAYQKTTPTGALKYASLDKIGGMSYKYNQLVQNGNFSDSTGWNALNGTLSVSNNVLTNTSSGGTLATFTPISKPVSHKVLVVFNAYASENISNLEVYCGELLKQNISISTTNTQYSFIATVGTGSNSNLNFSTANSSSGFTLSLSKVMVFDLTSIYGAGNEPSDVATAKASLLPMGINIDEYNAYNTGTIRSAKVSAIKISANLMNVSIESGIFDALGNKASNNRRIRTANKISLSAGTYTISFTGVNSVAVYIYDTNDVLKNTPSWQDTNEFTFTVDYDFKVNFAWRKTTDVDINPSNMTSCLLNKGSVVIPDITKQIPASIRALDGYGESNPDDSTEYNYIDFENKLFKRKGYIDNGEWVVSALDTDISSYIDNNFIEVEGGGSTTFNNTYNQAVPSEITYLVGVTE